MTMVSGHPIIADPYNLAKKALLTWTFQDMIIGVLDNFSNLTSFVEYNCSIHQKLKKGKGLIINISILLTNYQNLTQPS